MITSSIWKFEGRAGLLSCGIDSEQISRFDSLANRKNEPSPLIFSTEEINHCLSSADPATAFCASFCCKEALFKALRTPYNYPDCVLLSCFDTDEQEVGVSAEFCRDVGICSVSAQINRWSPGELSVIVYTWGN